MCIRLAAHKGYNSDTQVSVALSTEWVTDSLKRNVVSKHSAM